MLEQAEIFVKLNEMLRTGKKVALCTVIEKIGRTPAPVGTKMLVTEDGEVHGTIGGGYEDVVKKYAMDVLMESKPKILKFALDESVEKGEIETGLLCGGKTTVFIDVIDPKPRVVIVGSGHVPLSVYKLFDFLGFESVVVDDARETLTEARFPNAKLVYHESFGEALKEVAADERTHVIIAHGEPEHDFLALKRFMNDEIPYLGILGSKTKISMLKERLRNEGVPEENIAKIYAPVGLDINARTPEEIAVSIAAEVIKGRRKTPRGG